MNMAANPQEKDYQFFVKNKSRLCKEYPGQFLAIKNAKIIGSYNDEVSAYTETTKEHQPGTFIIQQASPEATATQVFHSRVVNI